MENTVLRELTWDAGAGRLLFKDVPYLLIRPETLVALQKAVEAELGERAGELLARGGHTGGALSTRRYREAFGLGAEETARFIVRMGREIGWGDFRLERLDLSAREIVVTVGRSPFAEAYGPASRPICHLIRGVLAGLAEGSFGAPAQAREVECLATGARACRFHATCA
ncbi:MAG: hypothetical protein HYY64_11305 [Candidatus Rokubacteria bacterium]|nr:hypothetical protein [Candidatus Rokubacteria bacterium]